MATTTRTHIIRRTLRERFLSTPWRPWVAFTSTTIKDEVKTRPAQRHAPVNPDIMPALTQNQRVDLANKLSAWMKAGSCSPINHGAIMKDILDWARLRAAACRDEQVDASRRKVGDDVLVRLTKPQAEALSHKLWHLQDEGQAGSGWASDELQELRDIVDKSIGAASTSNEA